MEQIFQTTNQGMIVHWVHCRSEEVGSDCFSDLSLDEKGPGCESLMRWVQATVSIRHTMQLISNKNILAYSNLKYLWMTYSRLHPPLLDLQIVSYWSFWLTVISCCQAWLPQEPSGNLAPLLNMTIEIVDLPMKHGDVSHCFSMFALR